MTISGTHYGNVTTHRKGCGCSTCARYTRRHALPFTARCVCGHPRAWHCYDINGDESGECIDACGCKAYRPDPHVPPNH